MVQIVFDASEKGSELLPPEWNLHPNYALRYVKDEKLHILLGVKSDMDLLLNLMVTYMAAKFQSQLIIKIIVIA